MKYTRITETYQ